MKYSVLIMFLVFVSAAACGGGSSGSGVSDAPSDEWSGAVTSWCDRICDCYTCTDEKRASCINDVNMLHIPQCTKEQVAFMGCVVQQGACDGGTIDAGGACSSFENPLDKCRHAAGK